MEEKMTAFTKTRVAAALAMALMANFAIETPTLAWDPVEQFTGKPIHKHFKRIKTEIVNAPKSYYNCVQRIVKCSAKTIKRLAYASVWPVIEGYKTLLFDRADGKWKALPSDFVRVA